MNRVEPNQGVDTLIIFHLTLLVIIVLEDFHTEDWTIGLGGLCSLSALYLQMYYNFIE